MFEKFQSEEKKYNIANLKFEIKSEENQEKLIEIVEEIVEVIKVVNTLKISGLNNHLEIFKRNMKYIGYETNIIFLCREEIFDKSNVKIRRYSGCEFYEYIQVNEKKIISITFHKIFKCKDIASKIDIWMSDNSLQVKEQEKLIKDMELKLEDIKRLKISIEELIKNIVKVEREFSINRRNLANVIDEAEKFNSSEDFANSIEVDLKNDEYKIFYAYQNIISLLSEVINSRYIYTSGNYMGKSIRHEMKSIEKRKNEIKFKCEGGK